MGNIATWLKNAEEQNGEQIEAIIIGLHYCDEFSEKDRRPEDACNQLLSRERGLEILNVEYNNGYGGADCYPMYAWSKSWVFSISEYDGATGLNQYPRNPVIIEPRFD